MPSRVKLGILGTLLAAGLVSQAEAGHFFRKCQPDCEKDVVRLPAREIVVETSRPNVIVNEARVERSKHARVVAPSVPVVATIFTPSFVPVAAPVVASSEICPEDRSRSLLHAAHSLEMQALELEKMRAVHKAEQAAMTQISQRVSASMRALTVDAPGAPGSVRSIDDDIRAELQKIDQRLTRLEELVIVHDKILRKQHEEQMKMKKEDQ